MQKSKFCIQIHVFYMLYPVVPVPFIEKIISVHFITFTPLSKVSWPYFCVSISVYYSVPLIGLSIIYQYTLSWWLQLYSKSWSQVVSLLQLCSSSVLCWLFCVVRSSIYILKSFWWYPQNNLKFWSGLCWIYRLLG